MSRHPLLERQLRRFGADRPEAQAPCVAFLDAVDHAYRDADAERELLQRAMEISSDELLMANSELRGIFNALPDVILHVDTDGYVRGHRGGSPANGWQASAVEGRRLADVCEGVPAATIDDALQTVFDARASVQFDCEMCAADGRRVYEVRLAPFAQAAIAVVRDVTEVRRADDMRVARDAAEDASRAKSAFIANMSHELRTPLNAIIGYSELLLEDADASAGADLQRIRAAGKHLLALINTLLDVARIEAGKVSVELETVTLETTMPEWLAAVRPQAEKNGNQLSGSCDPVCGTLRTDGTKLRQILLNLLSNACKFTSGGQVSLTVRRQSHAGIQGVAFAVRDTGIGIAPEEVHRLFQDFVQVEASSTRRYGGTGLGLSISRRLAGLLGGRVDVESRLGDGSTFTLWLPEAVPHGSSASADLVGAGVSGSMK